MPRPNAASATAVQCEKSDPLMSGAFPYPNCGCWNTIGGGNNRTIVIVSGAVGISGRRFYTPEPRITDCGLGL